MYLETTSEKRNSAIMILFSENGRNVETHFTK